MAVEFARSLPASLDQLPALLDLIDRWLTEAGVPISENVKLMIAFDELLSNIAKYGNGTIDLHMSVADGSFSATIADDGPRFDPLAQPAPDTELDIDARAIGGLGIHLVREMMDEVGYAHENGQNRLTFRKTY